MIAFGQGPQIGESVTGDVVNTASRLQNVARTGTIVVGEAAHHATAGVFEYEELPPVTVKGKAEPLAIWRPLRARSVIGVDPREQQRTTFVGRADESRHAPPGLPQDGAVPRSARARAARRSSSP